MGNRLPAGRITRESLDPLLARYGTPAAGVVLGPGIGEDAAVVETADRYSPPGDEIARVLGGLIDRATGRENQLLQEALQAWVRGSRPRIIARVQEYE